MNVRNEPLHVMACETWDPPPNGGGNIVSINKENASDFWEQIQLCGGGEVY